MPKSFKWGFVGAWAAFVLGCGLFGGGEEGTPPPVPIGETTPTPVVPGDPAQPAQPAQPAAAGGAAVSLRSGFQPDPHVVEGTSGGGVNASTMNPTCRGWVGTAPNHVLTAQTPFTTLRFVVNGGAQDTTLVVQKPDGTYVCDDDGGGNRHPLVNLGSTPAGEYKIWVGSYQQTISAPYRLGFSQATHMNASQVGAPAGAGGAGPSGATAATPSNFGTVTLGTGFQPDPHVVTGTSGTTAESAVDASGWDPSCRGHVTEAPDHIFVAQNDFAALRVLVRGQNGDTTLIIQKPDGSYMCNDDAEGRDPVVVGNFTAGAYKIWVGSYQSGQNIPYSLGFTERPDVRTRSLR